MKKLLPPNKQQHANVAAGILLALLLVLAQTVALAHDAIHFAHDETELCDTLSWHGKAQGLPATVILKHAVPPLLAPGCSRPLSAAPAAVYPDYHSRAPPTHV